MESEETGVIRRSTLERKEAVRRRKAAPPLLSSTGLRTKPRKRDNSGVIAGNVFWSESVREASPFGQKPTAIAQKRKAGRARRRKRSKS